jgi:uncharacterized protein (TIGR00369 family)
MRAVEKDATRPPAPELPPDLGSDHHRLLERVYHAAPTNGLTPARLEVGHGWAELAMEPSGQHLQAVGAVHGMLVCKVLDETAFYAANSLVGDVFLTTSELSVRFLAPADPGGAAHARAEVVHAGRSSFVVDAWAWNASPGGERRTYARATGTFVRTQVPLPS